MTLFCQAKPSQTKPIAALSDRLRRHGAGLALCLLTGWALFGHGVSAAEPEPIVEARFDLRHLIALAIKSHPSIAAKRAEHGATQAEVETARWQYYPTPSVQLRQEKWGTAIVLAVQQPLWAGGRIDAGLGAAQSRENAASDAIADAQYTLALKLTAAYQSWMQAHGRGEALARGVALLSNYADSVDRRIQGGATGDIDRELVAARLAQTQGDLVAARAAERSALAQLSQMVGQALRVEQLAAGVKDPGVLADPIPTLDELIDQAVSRSASLRRLDADIATARQEITQKRAVLWPTLNLRAEHQRNDGAAPASGLPASDSRLLLVLDYTPGAGLAAVSNIDAATARLGGLQNNREAARRDLIEKISADFEEHHSSHSRAQDLRRTLRASAKVLASYDRLFVAGRRAWLDVINAARELTQVEMSIADVDALRLASRQRLQLHASEFPRLPMRTTGER